mmetsp:Transcript_23684/g.55092  ORF Transcript_23684/g.55092 Transcript_23684/m.55092 type:complete len:204 (+) Transcript_23684:295-906(+)
MGELYRLRLGVDAEQHQALLPRRKRFQGLLCLLRQGELDRVYIGRLDPPRFKVSAFEAVALRLAHQRQSLGLTHEGGALILLPRRLCQVGSVHLANDRRIPEFLLQSISSARVEHLETHFGVFGNPSKQKPLFRGLLAVETEQNVAGTVVLKHLADVVEVVSGLRRTIEALCQHQLVPLDLHPHRPGGPPLLRLAQRVHKLPV